MKLSLFKILVAFLLVSCGLGSQKTRIKELFTELNEDADVLPQLIRMAFHDAAHFNQEDGVYRMGCFLEVFQEGCAAHGNMEPAIQFRQVIFNRLQDEGFQPTNADLTQLMGALAVDKLSEATDFSFSLFDQIRLGRPDIADCDDVCEHLPDFHAFGVDFHQRWANTWTASYVNKMIGAMGFSDVEAVALLGAHTVGRVRDQFDCPNSDCNGPWTMTPFVFDNEYFVELQSVATSQSDCPSGNPKSDCTHPFGLAFPDWFQDTTDRFINWFNQVSLANGNLNQVPGSEFGLRPLMTDADMALMHERPQIVNLFANNFDLWRIEFNMAYVKMSELGCTEETGVILVNDKDVNDPIPPPPCPQIVCPSLGACPAGASIDLSACEEGVECCQPCLCCMFPESTECVPSCPSVLFQTTCPMGRLHDENGCEIDECAPLLFEYESLGNGVHGFCRAASGVSRFLNDHDVATEEECKASCDRLFACAGYQHGRNGSPDDCNLYFAAETVSTHTNTFLSCRQKQGQLSIPGYTFLGRGFCRDASGNKFHLQATSESGEFECKLKCDANPLCHGYAYATPSNPTKCNMYTVAESNSGSGGLGGCWSKNDF